MKKIIDILKQKRTTFSFELFPPKTESGYENLLTTIEELSQLKPDFISCTYGAGGGNRAKTLEISQLIQDKHKIPSLAHLTCVMNTKDEIKNIVTDIKARGIQNILALRGDPPRENPDWTPGENNFAFSKDLTAFIKREHKDEICVATAGFPEGHKSCPNKELDAEYLKLKISSGAELVMTQVFFENNDYFDYIDRLRSLDVNVPVLPGIMPITNYDGIERFCLNDKIKLTTEVKRIFEPIREDKEATFKAGTEFAIKQGKELLAGGAPGLHFYSLNKISPTREILEAIRT